MLLLSKILYNHALDIPNTKITLGKCIHVSDYVFRKPFILVCCYAIWLFINMFAFYCNSAKWSRRQKLSLDAVAHVTEVEEDRQRRCCCRCCYCCCCFFVAVTASATASAHAHQQRRRLRFYQLRSASRIYRKTVEIVSSLPAHRVRFPLFQKRNVVLKDFHTHTLWLK